MTTNDPRQQQMIREAMKAIAERRPGRTKLGYDKAKRTIVAVVEGSQTPRALNITAEDADMFGIVTLSASWLRHHWARLASEADPYAEFSCWDDGDAFTQADLGPQRGPAVVQGTIGIGRAVQRDRPVRIELTKVDAPTKGDQSIFTAPDGAHYRVQAYRRWTDREEPLHSAIVDVQPALAQRRAALLETAILSDQSVVCVGLGTGGAHAALELAKCGVSRFALVDDDRLSVGNVARHPAGVSQVGRLKVKVVRDLILEKNPEASVSVYPTAIAPDRLDSLRPLFAAANLVIAGTDNRPSKLLINQLSIEANVTTLFGGAFRRAYGGQVLRVRPRRSPCYQCFVAAMPEEAADVEISSASEADAVAYSDRPVAIEPGLSLDVLPLATFLSKLALLELVAGRSTTLETLKRDYDAPWYLWLNRPEPGTPYAAWPPLSESSDEMTINRWYGIYFEQDSACPACGSFLTATANARNIDLTSVVLPSAPKL